MTTDTTTTVDGDFTPVVDEPAALPAITEEVAANMQVRPAVTGFGANLQPANQAELMHLCVALSKAGGAIPKSYQGNPGAIMVGIMAGAELGLSAMKALQGIAVINGVPSLYGMTAHAMVTRHRDFDDIEEWLEGQPEDADFAAHVIIRRKGRRDVHRSFSRKDAEAIKVQYGGGSSGPLWNKPGPWRDGYKARMCQWRARSLAYKDAFPDALLGFGIVEEMIDVTPAPAAPALQRGGGLTRASAILDSVRQRETGVVVDEGVVMAQGEGNRVVEPPSNHVAKAEAEVVQYCVKCGDSRGAHGTDVCNGPSCDGQVCHFESEPPDSLFAEADREEAARKSDVINPANEDEVAKLIAGELDLTTAKAVVKTAMAAGMTTTQLQDAIFALVGEYGLKKGPTVSALMGQLRSKTIPTA